MEKIYSNFGKLTDAEKLALKNVDLASRTGDIQRFNAGIDLAQRYNSTDFINKIGLKTDAEIKKMYGVLNNCNDPDIINQYRLYEYSTRHGYQMDAIIYVDKNGNILGTSLDKTYIPDNNDYQLSMTDSIKCSTEAELKSHSNLVKVEDAKAEAAKGSGAVDKEKDVDKATGEADKGTETGKETGEADKGTETGKETGEADKGTGAGKETGEVDKGTDIEKGKDTSHGTGDTPEHTNRNHLLDGSGSNDGTKVELSENSKKIISSYETASGQKVSTDFSPDMIKKVNKYADMLDFAGDALDLVDAGVSIYQAVNLFKSGDTNAGCKVLSDYGFSTLGGMGASALAAGIVGMCSLNPVVGFVFIFGAGFAGSELGKNFSDWWFEEVLGLYDDAGAYTYPVDPLILDLDGDGIETVALEKGVNFDFDNNGFAEKTGWIGKDDGLLVRDINKNGQIDNGGELFGDLTTVDDTVASNGFEALKMFDKNQDGIINSSDEIYSELQVWKDSNQNGKVDANELLSLSQLGITGFNLNYENINIVDENGNSHTQKSTYVKLDGSRGVLEDVWFQKDSADTIAIETNQTDILMEETEAIRKLPDIQGYGNQHSLHQAMLQDKTGELQELIESYVAESDLAKRKSMVTQIIYVWTGVAEESTTARGNNISDSRKLEALEVITGREFNSAYGNNPVYQAGQYIEQAFNKLVEMYYAQLERQTTYAEMYQHLYQNMDIDAQGNICYDTEEVVQILAETYEQDKKAGKEQAVKFFSNVKNCGMFQCVKMGCRKIKGESFEI